jgi:natural product precursor
MKKVNFTGKLGLNKETISKLNNKQLDHLKGGSISFATYTSPQYCDNDQPASGSVATNSPDLIINCCL